jgi:hypothetical protein
MGSINQPSSPKNAGNHSQNNKHPEIRDNLDSRKNEEQDIKGDDQTHNKKKERAKPKEK